MKLEQRTICLIPIPFTELNAVKRRPVLIISNSNYNNITNDITVMAISSNIESKTYSVNITNNDMEIGNLLRDSIIRIDKIYSINKSLVIKEFGKINIAKYQDVIDTLNDFVENK